MRFEEVETIQWETSDGQTIRLQTDIVAGNVLPTYDRQHSAGRFLDSVETLHRVSKSAEVGL